MRQKTARQNLFVHSQHPVLYHLTLFVLLCIFKFTIFICLLSNDWHKHEKVLHTTCMLIIFIRSIIIFILLLIVMRLMGKRQIGEMQPFEFIITLLIAEIACVPMSDISIPLTYGIVAVIAIFILHQIISILEQTCRTAKSVISGKPSLVINKNGVDIVELKKNNLDVEDLIEAIRNTGNFALDSIEYAIFESNGKISVLEKENYNSNQLPVLLITEGKLVKNNCKMLSLDDKFFGKILQKEKIKNIKQIDILTIDASGKIYLQIKGQAYKTYYMQLKENNKW